MIVMKVMKTMKAEFDSLIYRIFKHRKTTSVVLVVLFFMFTVPVLTTLVKYANNRDQGKIEAGTIESFYKAFNNNIH